MRRLLSGLLSLSVCGGVAAAQNHSLRDLPTFSSTNGVLNVLMIAKTKPIELAGMHPTAWVYEVCQRSAAVHDACPAGSATLSPYGGVRLQLQQGDHLKIRLINHLPPAPPDSDHAHGPDEMENEMLQANPTNLHTHGLIVEPRKADQTDRTFGDYVYVLGYPAGKKPAMQHAGMVYTDKPIDYDIYIPKNHPSGLFWFHPHVHGLSLNQISAGMSGVITVGKASDYLGVQAGSYGLDSSVTVRHLLLKDMEVQHNNTVLTQEDSAFCEPDPEHANVVRPGWCAGIKQSDPGGTTDYTGGKWIFSVNGQVFPSVRMAGKGEVWRMVSGSGSAGYSLSLRDDDTGALLPMQLLSLDGVSIDSGSRADDASTKERLGNRIEPASCGATFAPGRRSQPVCATSIRMMPSARTEIWVPSHSQGSRHATLITHSLSTGPDGDDWPAVGLMRVEFAASAAAAQPAFLEVEAGGFGDPAGGRSVGVAGADFRAWAEGCHRARGGAGHGRLCEACAKSG